MSDLFEMVTTTLGPMGPILVLGALGLILIAFTLPFILTKKKDPFNRIQSPTQQSATSEADKTPAASLRYTQKKGPNLDKFASFLEPQDVEEFSKKRLNLLRAGSVRKMLCVTFISYSFPWRSLARSSGLFMLCFSRPMLNCQIIC